MVYELLELFIQGTVSQRGMYAIRRAASLSDNREMHKAQRTRSGSKQSLVEKKKARHSLQHNILLGVRAGIPVKRGSNQGEEKLVRKKCIRTQIGKSNVTPNRKIPLVRLGPDRTLGTGNWEWWWMQCAKTSEYKRLDDDTTRNNKKGGQKKNRTHASFALIR